MTSLTRTIRDPRTSIISHLVLATLIALPGVVAAAVMTFDGMIASGYVSYAEDGLLITSNASIYLYLGGGGKAIRPSDNSQVFTFGLDGGGPFTMDSIDIMEYGSGPQTVVFEGVQSGGGTVTFSITTDGISGYETFAFPPEFSDLDAVSWDQVDPLANCVYDNVVATAGPVPSKSRTWGELKGAFSRR